MRPRLCSSIRIESSRLACIGRASVAGNADTCCQLWRPMMRAIDSKEARTMDMTTTLAPARTQPPALEDCAVVELRDYTLHPGRRDELIALFEGEFIEAQEAAGMR